MNHLLVGAWVSAIATSLATILGCDAPSEERRAQRHKQVAEEAYTEDHNNWVLTYSVDPRTGLCFASHGTPGYYAYTITNVPCTPAVCELGGGCK